MITPPVFDLIKKKYGHYASWAIWAEEGEKPKDKVGDLSVFDIKTNVNLLEKLNPNIILVGLNISGASIEIPFSNFHSPRHQAMDFKIRYALKNSCLWGAYMTDIIKDFKQMISKNVMSYLKDNRQFEEENIGIFLGEIDDLGVSNPTIIAFGGDVYSILKRNFNNKYILLKIPHYSHYISKEKYREKVKCILKFGKH